MNQYLLYLLVYSVSLIVFLLLYETKWFPVRRKRKSYVPPSTKPPERPQVDFGNLPDVYLYPQQCLKRLNKTCAVLPQLFDIRFSPEPWQKQKISNGTFELFSAHLDDRNGTTKVRIIAMLDQVVTEQRFYCQIWYRTEPKPEIVKTEKLLMLWYKEWGGNWKGLLHPYVITCPLKKNSKPVSVSLVEKPCRNASNNLKINYPKVDGEQKNFVVCVKGLNFPFKDISVRLIEWIELLFYLGVDKISFYKFSVHEQVERVLRYYEDRGEVEVVPIRLVGDAPNTRYLQYRYLRERRLQRRLQEVIPYNDCLYRHLKQYRYVVLLDVDEVIVPARRTWTELMDRMRSRRPNRTSFVVGNVYFLNDPPNTTFDDIPRFMYMLTHVYRTANYSDNGYYVKGFHDTRFVVGLHNHYPFYCIGKCHAVLIVPATAHLQHYKNRKHPKLRKNQTFTMDTRIWNFKDEVIDRTAEVLSKLKIKV